MRKNKLPTENEEPYKNQEGNNLFRYHSMVDIVSFPSKQVSPWTTLTNFSLAEGAAAFDFSWFARKGERAS